MSQGNAGEPETTFGFWDEVAAPVSAAGLWQAGVSYSALVELTDPVSRAVAMSLRAQRLRGWCVHTTLVGDEVMTGLVLQRSAGRAVAARLMADAVARGRRGGSSGCAARRGRLMV